MVVAAFVNCCKPSGEVMEWKFQDFDPVTTSGLTYIFKSVQHGGNLATLVGDAGVAYL